MEQQQSFADFLRDGWGRDLTWMKAGHLFTEDGFRAFYDLTPAAQGQVLTAFDQPLTLTREQGAQVAEMWVEQGSAMFNNFQHTFTTEGFTTLGRMSVADVVAVITAFANGGEA